MAFAPLPYILAGATALAALMLLADPTSAGDFWAPSMDAAEGFEGAVYDTDATGFMLDVYNGNVLQPGPVWVPPGGVHRQTHTSPWAFDTCIHLKGVYHYVTSDDNVGATIYQVDYVPGGKTLAGAAMLPKGALGVDHIVATYGNDGGAPVSFAVVIAPASMAVTVMTPAAASVLPGTGPSCVGVAGVAPGSAGTYFLNAGEALLLASNDDITGLRIRTDSPAVVYSGTMPVKVGPMGAGDFLIEPIRPIQAGGLEFVACYPAWVTQTGFAVMVRAVALAGGTTNVMLTTGASTTLSGPGEFFDFFVNQNVLVTSDQDIAVFTYLFSGWSDADGEFVALIPREHWTSSTVLDRIPPQASDINPVTHRVYVAMVGIPAATVGGVLVSGWQQIPGTVAYCGEQNLGSTTSGPVEVNAVGSMTATMLSTGAFSSIWYTAQTPPECMHLGLRQSVCDPCNGIQFAGPVSGNLCDPCSLQTPLGGSACDPCSMTGGLCDICPGVNPCPPCSIPIHGPPVSGDLCDPCSLGLCDPCDGSVVTMDSDVRLLRPWGPMHMLTGVLAGAALMWAAFAVGAAWRRAGSDIQEP